MRAKCEKIKVAKVEIKDAWDRGDRDEVYNLVGALQLKCDAINLE